MNNPAAHTLPPAMLASPEVLELVCIKSRSKLYEMIRQGKFPAPVKLGARTSRWPRAVVEEWIAQQISTAKAA